MNREQRVHDPPKHGIILNHKQCGIQTVEDALLHPCLEKSLQVSISDLLCCNQTVKQRRVGISQIFQEEIRHINDAPQRLLVYFLKAFGKIDVLLNNAGYAAIGAFEAATEAQIKRQFDVNVLGVLRTTQALLPHFRQSDGGTVINVSSVGGRVAFPLLSLYHASKWAIEGFSESLFYEMAAHQIKVKLVEPGNVATDFTGRSLDLLTDTSLDAYASYTETVLQKQMNSFDVHASEPKLIAETIFEAATDPSDRFRYLVGADAHYLMDLRSKTSDEEFMAGITKQFS
ncbi:MAG TPA: short-chain dehydrogenase/reductase [Paenibacillus lactis]|uniref:Short-chain dehydrogenase/reductase SDR n=1 Tax=Paenibacillus lactis 154 TaxID=743719 RepID=G4H8P7_9BACL|nr:short-chain dehydrogenase/reductase SDR [Paenibacillus lactis 154]HAF99633.1 short-chain dehydrogenase/reductase [Paenibacillus lactis]